MIGNDPAPGRRAVYGRIYETISQGQADSEHWYVGKTTQTIHQRVHVGPRAHTSSGSIARDPWKATILLGKAGYRLLETVYDTGDPLENERALRRAEAFWIDRLRPIKNSVRPVRPRAVPTAGPRPRSQQQAAVRHREVRARWRTALLLLVVAFFTVLAARVAVAMQMPWPVFPWVAAPTVGLALGWATFWRLHAGVRRVARGGRR